MGAMKKQLMSIARAASSGGRRAVDATAEADRSGGLLASLPLYASAIALTGTCGTLVTSNGTGYDVTVPYFCAPVLKYKG